MSVPQVSVCIPSYNCERFIGQAVGSVLGQTFTDWELIVMDDASSDNTLDLVRSYNDPRIRLIESDRNLGLEGNWNRILAEARGRYLKLLPSDDHLLPDCLEKQVAYFERPGAERVVLVSAGRRVVDQFGSLLMKRVFPGRKGRIAGYAAVRRIIRAGTNILGEPGAILFKRQAFERAGRFDGSLAYVIDVDMWVRLLFSGDLYVLPDILCAFRVSSDSCSVKISSLQSRHFSAFIRMLSRVPELHVSWLDEHLGILSSRVLALGRRMVYLVTVGWKAGN